MERNNSPKQYLGIHRVNFALFRDKIQDINMWYVSVYVCVYTHMSNTYIHMSNTHVSNTVFDVYI